MTVATANNGKCPLPGPRRRFCNRVVYETSRLHCSLNLRAFVRRRNALGSLRLLLSGPTSSAGRPMPDGARPEAGGWNRIHLIVDDLPGEVARLRAAGAQFRNDIVTGPGGWQVLLRDPSGNLVELFQPARRQ